MIAQQESSILKQDMTNVKNSISNINQVLTEIIAIFVCLAKKSHIAIDK